MKTVLKFPIAITDCQIVRMPQGAQIIHVGLDPTGRPCVWAKVETTCPVIERALFVTGTGHEVPDGAVHLGSFNQESFVWHVWEPAK